MLSARRNGDAIAKALGIYKLLDWIEKRCKGEK